MKRWVKRWCSLLVACCILWPMTGAAARAGVYSADTLQQLIEVARALPGGGYANGVLTLPAGNTVYITQYIALREDLTLTGGGRIMRASSCVGANVPVFWVQQGVVLTLTNLTVDGGALWTQGTTAGANGGTVANGPAITLQGCLVLGAGGVVCNNDVLPAPGYSGMGGGGVWMGAASALLLEGGSICNNRVQGSGGGVYMREGATLSATGGGISGNRAYPDPTMPDGAARTNGQGGGIFVGAFASGCTLSGDVDLSGNTCESGASDICLDVDQMVRFTAPLKRYIGIYSAVLPPANRSLAIAAGSGYALTQADAARLVNQSPRGSVAWEPASALATLCTTLGDVVGDGTVSAYDALCALQFALGVSEPTAAERLAADVTLDEQITSYDALRILQCALGLVSAF